MAEMTYSSNGKGNLGVTLGAIGTGLGILGGMGNLGGISSLLGGSSNNYVSQETFDKQNEIAELNAKIALLEADKNTESKMIDVYERTTTRILENERSYAEDKMAQAVVNANFQSAIAVNSNNIQQLMNMTKLYIPSSNVSPQPMNLYNSWTAPTTTTSTT